MSSLLRSKKRASEETEERKFNRAYVLPAKMGDDLIAFLQEMPIKYNPVLSQLIIGLQNAMRADVTLNVPKTQPTKPVKAEPTKKKEKDEKEN